MIDCHVHQPSGDAYPPGEYLAFMDELGVERAVVFTYDGLLGPSPALNDSLARFAADERFVAFATVDPRRPDAAGEVERCVREHGMRGVKLHPWLQGFSPHGEFMDALCELGLPILFHDGTPPYSAPLQIAVLARRHANTAFVLGHGGLHDLWREAAAAAELPNVHVCMCATPPYAMRRLVERVPLERLLFGTDGGLAPAPRQAYVALRIRQLERLGLSPRQRRAILDENPRRLLGLA
jgi:predicted TIM-barrel fold metal-dependent hydrolase